MNTFPKSESITRPVSFSYFKSSALRDEPAGGEVPRGKVETEPCAPISPGSIVDRLNSLEETLHTQCKVLEVGATFVENQLVARLSPILNRIDGGLKEAAEPKDEKAPSASSDVAKRILEIENIAQRNSRIAHALIERLAAITSSISIE